MFQTLMYVFGVGEKSSENHDHARGIIKTRARELYQVPLENGCNVPDHLPLGWIDILPLLSAWRTQPTVLERG